MKCQTTLLSCAQEDMAFEVSSVPLSNTIMPGLPPRDPGSEFARHPSPGYRSIGDRRQAHSRHLVDDIQETEPSAMGERVVDEIHRPTGVGNGLDQDRRPRFDHASPGPPFRQTHDGLQVRDARVWRRALPFSEKSSRSAATSSLCSAKSFFSFAFLSSSCFSRLASETSMPPNSAFQL